MREASEIRAERGEHLRPLYGAQGEVTLTFSGECEVYRRGDAAVEIVESPDLWVFGLVGALVRWEAWLHKARVGTLRWLAAQEGRLGAGKLGTTAAVRSQLTSAGLAKPSDLWGDEVTEDGYRLALWARFELDRRQV